MKLKSKISSLLAAATLAGGMLAAAPANATLTLLFLDGNNQLLDFAQVVACCGGDPYPTQTINYSGRLNGWNITASAGTTTNTQADFGFGMLLNATVNRFNQDTTEAGGQANNKTNFTAGGFNSTDYYGILKMRFSDTEFPLTLGQTINFASTLSVSNGNAYQAANGGLGYNTSLTAFSPVAFEYNKYTGLIGSGSYNGFSTLNASRGDNLIYGPSTSNPFTLEAGVDFVSADAIITDPVNVLGGFFANNTAFKTDCVGSGSSNGVNVNNVCPGFSGSNQNAFSAAKPTRASPPGIAAITVS